MLKSPVLPVNYLKLTIASLIGGFLLQTVTTGGFYHFLGFLAIAST